MVLEVSGNPATARPTLESEWEDSYSAIAAALQNGAELHPGDIQRRELVITLLRAAKAYNLANAWAGLHVVEPKWTDDELKRMAVFPDMAIERIKEPYLEVLDCFVISKSLEQHEIKHLHFLAKDVEDSQSSNRDRSSHGRQTPNSFNPADVPRYDDTVNQAQYNVPASPSHILRELYETLPETGVTEAGAIEAQTIGPQALASLAKASTLEEALLMPDLSPFGSVLRLYAQDLLAATEIYTYQADLYTAGYRAAARHCRPRALPIMEDFESDKHLSLLFQSLLRVVLRATLNYRKRLEKFRGYFSSSQSCEGVE